MDKFTHDICKVLSKQCISFSSPSNALCEPATVLWSDETMSFMTANKLETCAKASRITELCCPVESGRSSAFESGGYIAFAATKIKGILGLVALKAHSNTLLIRV